MSDIQLIDDLKNLFINDVNQGKIASWQQYEAKINEHNSQEDLIELLKNWYYSITEPHFLKELSVDTEELFIHNSESCYIKIRQRTVQIRHDYTPLDLNLVLLIIAIKEEQNWSYKNPFCSFNYKIGNKKFRATFIHHSLNPEGENKAFFRVLKNDPIELNQYSHSNLLQDIVRLKKNILIAGSTGSGKTTLINSLLNQVDKNEHVVIIEDTYELISPNERTSRLLDDTENLHTLLSYSLRMSPDRLVLGEIRSKEILTYILAMNTGHNGVLSSIHSNNAKDALHRLALLYTTYAQGQLNYQQTLKLICSNMDYVVFMKDKKIHEVIEVFGSEGQSIFYDDAV